MSGPAYTRLESDERRRLLLDRAAELFATHGYDELSMARIARESGTSKALLYHYFPSKKDLFVAALSQGAEGLLAITETDSSAPPIEQLSTALGAYLDWIDGHREAYAALMRSAGLPEVRELVEGVREQTAQRILDGLGEDGERPVTRAAVRGWLWFMDGVCLDWVAAGGFDRDQAHGMLLGALGGALLAAGVKPFGME